jgi:hypothetical protein
MGAFILDSHAVQRLATPEGDVIDEGNFDVAIRPYQIPYRCITPKREECENLLVPVALSASHVTYGSIRMEPQFMILGHSAGVAAAMALQANVPMQDIDVAALQAKLRAQNQVLELAITGSSSETLPGVVLDDEEATYTGDWTNSNFGNALNGASHHDQNIEKGQKSARFELKVPRAGRYEVRFAYSPAPNRASNVPLTIEAADGRKTSATVNERLTPPLERLFISLGTFEFAPAKPAVVTVTNAGTDGFVSVDAVQLLPVP